MPGRRVIIDDDHGVRDSLAFLLETRGYSLRAHASAELFLAGWSLDADCLLVDHHMPGMSGLDLLAHLRAKGDYTPALLITGRSDPSILKRAQNLAVPVLFKPVDEDELVHHIELRRASPSRPDC